MRILMILIPQSNAGDGKGDPAVPVERAAGPYYVFKDLGVEVVMASPDGGSPPMDFAGGSTASTEAVLRFKQDRTAIDEFSDTLSLEQVYTDDFDAAFCVGGPGSIWRPEHSNSAGALISRLLEAGKPVAIMPSGIDLAPKGTSEGLLILGDGSKSPIRAAHALIGAVMKLQPKPERNAP